MHYKHSCRTYQQTLYNVTSCGLGYHNRVRVRYIHVYVSRTKLRPLVPLYSATGTAGLRFCLTDELI